MATCALRQCSHQRRDELWEEEGEGGRQINLNVNAGASSTHHGALEGVELLEKFRIF